MFGLDPVLLVKVTGFGGFLWLGLFIISRAGRQTALSIVSMLGMLAMASYLLSSTLIGNNNMVLGFEGSILLARSFWWANLVPGAFWFHLTQLISYQSQGQGPQKRIFTWPVVLVYIGALVICLPGTFSDLFLDYTHSRPMPDTHIYTDVGPSYILFILYILVTLGGGFLYLLRAWLVAQRPSAPNSNSAPAAQLRLLLVGGLLFLVGGLWLACNFYFKLGVSELWGNLFLLTGLALLGYGVAHFSLLVDGQDVQRDFIYSFTLTTLVCLVYAVLLGFSGANSSLNVLVVVGLAVLSHTTFDYSRGLLDKIFFSNREQLARSEARAYATAIASQPVALLELEQALAFTLPAPASDVEENELGEEGNLATSSQPEFNQKNFNDLVRKALTGLKNPPEMIKSPLLSLSTIEVRLRDSGVEDNRLNRVAVLREWLIQLIDELRPVGSAASGTGDAWRFYNVLYYPYVREISRKGALVELRRIQHERRQNNKTEPPGDLERALEWLVDVDENTFYKWQRKASDAIASIIREQEVKQPVRQAV